MLLVQVNVSLIRHESNNQQLTLNLRSGNHFCYASIAPDSILRWWRPFCLSLHIDPRIYFITLRIAAFVIWNVVSFWILYISFNILLLWKTRWLNWCIAWICHLASPIYLSIHINIQICEPYLQPYRVDTDVELTFLHCLHNCQYL